ncbi:hypothetical protein CJA_0853 [Cellvibrio japonicus Ueda107]|uniref:Uncharacterized protein n=1 Tax=Cellvibrio japonicus (strain Ueda107) TaxID=498211 RepID=B3PKU6_CELJU|nr:hypothetical protein CJA_0853 [Cellvibrio japonicus Ueda107]
MIPDPILAAKLPVVYRFITYQIQIQEHQGG